MTASDQKGAALKDFSHVKNFTGYMQIVFDEVVSAMPRGARILDVPAGNGLLGERLREMGYQVVQADINDERPDYVFADMERPLPFADGQFDAVICLEGIEHVLQQNELLAELVRITKSEGLVVISTPNVTNLWSRLVFLFRGFFYQFDPRNARLLAAGLRLDKGHISPISLYQLAYQMAARGARLERTYGDRFKKKVLLPLALLLWAASAWPAWRVEAHLPNGMLSPRARGKGLTFNLHQYMSRSLIAIFRRD